MQAFPTELLQAFVAVIDEGSFTAAGSRLGLTQSAITAQIKRLETQAGCALLLRNTRSLSLTAQGEVMLQGAREILSLHGSLREHLGIVHPLHGRLRIGISEGYLCASLATALRRFLGEHPGVQIEMHVDFTQILLDRLHDELLDVVVGVHCDADEAAESLWSEGLVWGYCETAQLPPAGPLPMVFAPEPCPYRAAATAALSAQRIAWRVACVSPSFSSCLSAASMGLGVVPLLRSELSLANLRDVGEEASLPPLPKATLSFWYPRSGATGPAGLIADVVRNATQERRAALALRVPE
jgi:DNA-binding transcriptional LysR family regulator